MLDTIFFNKKYIINLEQNLTEQIDKIINDTHDKIYIQITKMKSLYKLINILQKNIMTRIKKIIITCLPHEGDRLNYSNRHKYSVLLDNGNKKIYVNDKYIDASKKHITIDSEDIDKDFILDIFRLFSIIFDC